ncbi:MotA/TolQ/ExbB proton channel family protein [Amphritea opalescens]|uniref:MotA/TolQ/ExbB proton channel family protein n=1 Tax=Amphritea opalescens TaxID=2490544 RepID=A0A430KSK2_9GAMM|nr:MotA/TolQ/ExbB proton channel family protein [Amphritea opalescens]RTE66314.1 MotA/TolQ/ExbB proton channel family protein [Amphritea opalescens]
MNIFALAQQYLGPLGIPLLICCVLTLLILLERIAVLCYHSMQRSLPTGGMTLLNQHADQPHNMRTDIAAIWLHHRQRRLSHGIRLLQIIALVAPLLGLLGTVIGLIQVFDSLGGHKGPIDPSMMAEGLGVAMKTTAAGLIIAIPAVVGAHGFQLWVDKLVSMAEQVLNVGNLRIEGVSIEALK